MSRDVDVFAKVIRDLAQRVFQSDFGEMRSLQKLLIWNHLDVSDDETENVQLIMTRKLHVVQTNSLT